MSNPLNGTAMTSPEKPQGMDGRTLVNHAKGVLIVFARGMFSLLASLQYEGLLVCIAQAMGEVAAESCWCDDVVHTIKLRKRVAEAFEHGMKAVPSMPPVMPGQVMAQRPETRQ
jgi:hypothetical protein